MNWNMTKPISTKFSTINLFYWFFQIKYIYSKTKQNGATELRRLFYPFSAIPFFRALLPQAHPLPWALPALLPA